jgi:predicted regulator of Ras-like GTPase activity (Roadblock/LC7/MglB family)
MTKMDKVQNTDISGLAEIGGFIGACLVDSESGLMLGSEGGGANFDLEAAAAANTEVVRAKQAAMRALGLNDAIEDILITLGTQFHLIRPLADTPEVFIYVALDKKAANLGMARIQVKKVEKDIAL